MTEQSAPPKPKRRVVKKKPVVVPNFQPTGEAADATTSTAKQRPNPDVPAISPMASGEASRIFLLAVAVGLGFAVLALIDNPILRWLGFFAPVLTTVAYPVWGYTRGIHRQASLREKFADNCYYLGFIFTQIALVVGFLPVALLDQEIGSQDVLRFFGMALGASLTGLLARTLLTQTGNNLSENADIIEAEVEGLAVRIGGQARVVLSEFEALAEGLAANQRALNDEFARSMTSLTHTVSSYDGAFKRDAAAMESGVAAVAAATSMTVADLSDRQKSLADNLATTALALGALRDTLNRQVDDTVAVIKDAGTAISTGAGSLARVGEMAGSFDHLGETLANIDSQLESFDGAVSRSREAATSSLQAIESLVGEARDRASADAKALSGSMSESASAFSGEMKEAAASLEKTLAAFRQELERLRV